MNREKLKLEQRKWSLENKQKLIVHKLAKIIKIPFNTICEVCNKNKAIQKHHEDYSKPFNIIFVCASCHNKLNKERKKRERLKS